MIRKYSDLLKEQKNEMCIRDRVINFARAAAIPIELIIHVNTPAQDKIHSTLAAFSAARQSA